MLYLVDQNTDKKREKPADLPKVGPEVLGYLGPDAWILEMRSWNLPAWNEFFDKGKADAALIARMLGECARMPNKACRIGFADELKRAVPPLEIATD